MIDDLSMAHDNLHRELADIKRLIGKDKHALIKANIALNKRVQELEQKLAEIRFVNNDYDKTNKRYREYLELIRITGTHGKDIKTGEIIRSDEANLAEEALEGEKQMAIAFKCDRCGKFEENKKGVKNFIKKEYRISFPIYIVNNFFGWKVRGIDVCQDCFESFEKWMESEQ